MIESDRRTATAQSLSALADGELDPEEVAPLCAGWRDDPESRARWHAYHLIGDVLRSDDLASSARHDSAFVASLRSRLAQEAVVLAPDPAPPKRTADDGARRVEPAVAASPFSARRRQRFWYVSSAVAAGVVMVVGAALVMKTVEPSPDASPRLARSGTSPASPAPVVPLEVAATARELPDPPPVAADAKLIRDARLDRYLAAHKQFSGSSVLGVPSGFLRDAATDAPSR